MKLIFHVQNGDNRMRKFKTTFKNFDETLRYGLSKGMTERTFENWEFELDYVEKDSDGKWGYTHIDIKGYSYPDSKITEIKNNNTIESALSKIINEWKIKDSQDLFGFEPRDVNSIIDDIKEDVLKFIKKEIKD